MAIRMKCDVMIRFATSCGHRKDIPFQGGGSTRKYFEILDNVEDGGRIFQGLDMITL